MKRPPAERLQACRHFRQQRRIAVAHAEHDGPHFDRGIARGQPGEHRPALEPGLGGILEGVEMVVDPDGVEALGDHRQHGPLLVHDQGDRIGAGHAARRHEPPELQRGARIACMVCSFQPGLRRRPSARPHGKRRRARSGRAPSAAREPRRKARAETHPVPSGRGIPGRAPAGPHDRSGGAPASQYIRNFSPADTIEVRYRCCR